MLIYNIKDEELMPIKKVGFKNEKELQTLTEKKLGRIIQFKICSY